MSFFGGSPFSTPVGQRIEQATDAALPSENWALNIEICDLINETEEGPKDALKAIRKRLQQNVGKNYTVVMYALTVLETCVKNCGKRFHVLACNKEFIQELVKLIGPKNDPPTAVQEKVLSLIQSWADAFHSQPDMSGVVQVYNDLRQKGIEFPMTDLDTLAPIHTPRRSVSASAAPAPPPVTKPAVPHQHVPQVAAQPSPTGATNPTNLTPEQLAKLRSELDIVRGNMTVLSEMLTELTPGKEHPSDLELLQELYATCQSMQARLVELVERVSNDEVTAELLHLNDELNNLFLRYSRYERNKDPTQPKSPRKAAAQPIADDSPALIDLGDDPVMPPAAAAGAAKDVTPQLASLSLGPNASALGAASKPVPECDDSEFDMFAQSRKVNYESSKKGTSSYVDNTHLDQTSLSLGAAAQVKAMHRESDFDEMEDWLKTQANDMQPPSITGAAGADSMSSSEFDRFLAERAAASDSTTPSRTGAQGQGQRPMDKGDAQNKSLFAL